MNTAKDAAVLRKNENDSRNEKTRIWGLSASIFQDLTNLLTKAAGRVLLKVGQNTAFLSGAQLFPVSHCISHWILYGCKR